MIPLSTRMRPEKLEDFVGQEHFLSKGSLFYNAIKEKNIRSAIFFGPSGTGKTTLSRIIAKNMDSHYMEINATTTGTKDLKGILETANQRFYGLENKTTLLYVDEIHRWNKLQQDTLLKAIEEGYINFIGSTTENPYFSINNAILSRVGNIYQFRKLSTENIEKLLKNSLEDEKKGFGNLNIEISSEALQLLAQLSSGDGRTALDKLGFIVDNLVEPYIITEDLVGEAFQKKIEFYHREEDKYNYLSALQKSIRGSDPNAAIYYFAKLVEGGAEINLIGRRLMVMASEDIGLAYPSAISIVESCISAANQVGYPEAALILSQAVILLASSPKSNKITEAYHSALNDIRNREIDDVPFHLRDAHYKGATDLGYGIDYKYPHDFGGYVKQQYLPDNLHKEGRIYYNPTNNGNEKAFREFLEGLKKIYGDN